MGLGGLWGTGSGGSMKQMGFPTPPGLAPLLAPDLHPCPSEQSSQERRWCQPVMWGCTCQALSGLPRGCFYFKPE